MDILEATTYPHWVDLRKFLRNLSQQLITVEATKTASIPGNPSGAATASMTLMTSPSLQSDQADTPSGPVESCSGCAHLWVINVQMAESTWKHHLGNLRCIHGCGAMRSFDLTPALAAGIT